jgi:4-diphosphocytidyl-2-C-methyl-D-erythritol kinase
VKPSRADGGSIIDDCPLATLMRAPFTATWQSPAKVNLCLRIVGKRSDGYHLLDSIFAAIDLCDRVSIVVADVARDRATRITIRCPDAGVPLDATNLAARAALTLLNDAGVGADVDVDLVKRIPAGAGLGGGSSNAATVLAGLNHGLRLGIAAQRLRELAVQLGADVPFFLTGGCARVRAIGEDVEPIAGWPGLPLLVALPPLAVSTAWAFRNFAAPFARDADEPSRMAAGLTPSADLLVNDLETTVLPAHPLIAQVKEAFLDAGASAAVMSGSGAAVVAVVPPSRGPDAIAAAVLARHPDVVVH